MSVAMGTGVRGLDLVRREIICINRTGAVLTQYEIVRLDLSGAGASETGTTLHRPGATDSGLVNIVDLDDDSFAVGDFGVFLIALGATANDAEGLFLIQGRSLAMLDGDSVDIVIGDPLEQNGISPGALTRTVDGAAVTCAIAMEGETGATDVAKIVLFDGLHGFGGTSTQT